MINPAVILKMKGAWDIFAGNHPKFPLFLKAAAQGAIQEDSIIEIAITTPEGKKIDTNLVVKREDLELIQAIKEMME